MAKTLLARTLAQTLDVPFRRIQFTPDLLPSDVLGGVVYRKATEQFVVQKGPLFAGVVLADELNRSPPKVQSALLEAMEERQVTLGGHTLPLPEPFLVLATQNPLEQQGTYPLAEAQVDRFVFQLVLSYPSETEEVAILDQALDGVPEGSPPAVTVEEIRAARDAVALVHVDSAVRAYVASLVRASREPGAFGITELDGVVDAGVSPRGGILLARAARARAGLRGRDHVLPEDVRALAPSVLRHRILLSVEAEVDGWTTDRVAHRLLEHVPVP